MKSILRIIPGLLLLAWTACQKVTEPDPVEPAVSVTAWDIPADTAQPPTGLFTFYSLRDSAIVPQGDSATNMWDLALRGTTILINGGTSRAGSGGAVVLRGTDFDTLSEAPEGDYAVDTGAVTQLAIPTGSGNGWYSYTGAAGTPPNTILPIPGVVIVVKTGDGKYAKVQILSYYKGNPAIGAITPTGSRFYTFKYVLQADGTRRLK